MFRCMNSQKSGSPHREMYVFTKKKGTLWVSFMNQCSSPVHGSATVFLSFFFVDFCPKDPPAQTCISISVFFTLTHANVRSLASALIYCIAVIVILSLTTLSGFSLPPPLPPSVFPIVNLLCLAGFYWFSLYVSWLWSLKTMIYFWTG